uniref:Uncharacterized protein n=1 Tax=Glossina austeni TaxID=7395 RepID=A0A1A9USI3_GLOAU
MVASIAQQSCVLSSTVNGTTTAINGIANNNTTLPVGRYILVGVDVDTTGRRLIDEIVQLAAYTPKDHFEQYIMPYMNLNPAARQRHQVRVISIGFYRMLKSTQTYKIIKSKSEIAALKDFLDWLEALKSRDVNSQGIILLYHEDRKFIPYMILESLKKYNLLDRFLHTVKSFANGLNLAKASANDSPQHYTLRKLSKILKTGSSGNNKNNEMNDNNANIENSNNASDINQHQKNKSNGNNNNNNSNNDRELFEGNASVRAKLAYEVALHLSNQDNKELLDSSIAVDKMLNALQTYAKPIECDLNELQTQNENLERQNSFRPVFLNYFKTTIYHRVRAVKFRIILAEHGYDLATLNSIWSDKKRDGLVEVLQVIDELKVNDKTELADLFDSYFDPNKTTIKPIVKNNNRRRNRRGGKQILISNIAKTVKVNESKIKEMTLLVRNVRNGGNTPRNGALGSSAEQGAGGDKQAANTSANIPDSTTKTPKTNRGKRNSRLRNNLKTPMASEAPIANQATIHNNPVVIAPSI